MLNTGTTWILGPCSMEDWDLYHSTALQLAKLMDGQDWYYKASFDKANRTSNTGGRGPGIEKGLDFMRGIKQAVPGIKLTTDIHECHQAEAVAGLVDVIQIPAFLCRQTDLLHVAGLYCDIVNIKKGQWVNPDSPKHFPGKVKHGNPNAKVWLTERGTSFGYSKLIVDFGAVDVLKEGYDKLILDCTHSTQAKKGDFTGGDRDLAVKYLIAAPIFGYTGIFAETHPFPPAALSDADCQIKLSELAGVLNQYDKIWSVIHDGSSNCSS